MQEQIKILIIQGTHSIYILSSTSTLYLLNIHRNHDSILYLLIGTSSYVLTRMIVTD
jgi:hypothetical protein